MMHMHKFKAAWATLLLALFIQAHHSHAANPPVITSATADSVTAGQPYSYQIAASSTLPIKSFSATPLPAGISVNNTTGLISGSTTAVGTFIITLSATNDAGTGTAELELTVNAVPPNISNSLSATGSVGVPFNFDLSATGIPAPTFTATPLPPGVTFTGNSITGTPLQAGTTFVNLTATNDAGADSKVLTIVITAPPIITSALVVPGTVGQLLTYDIVASNSPQSFSVVGAFPAGINTLSVNSSTGRVQGTPTAAGTYSVVLRAVNTVNGTIDPCVFNNTVGTGTATVTFAISQTAGAPAITSTLTARAKETVPFVYGINATNSPTSYSAVGLPTGMNIDTTTGVIFGAPGLNTANSSPYNVTITATNAAGSGSATLVLTVDAPIPEITSTTANQVTFSMQPFKYQTTATSYPLVGANTYSVTFIPAIPSGNLSIAATTGLLSGTPTSSDVGNYIARIRATNARGFSEIDVPIFIVNQLLSGGSPPIVITSPLRAVAIVGCPFKYQIEAAGANCFNAAGLPAHLVIDTDSGFISGTPQMTDVGTYNVTLSAGVTVISCVTATQATLQLTVLAAPVQPPNPTLTGANSIGATLGNSISYSVTTSPNFTDPTQFQIPLQFSASGIPLGLGLSPDKILSIGSSVPTISGVSEQVGTSNVRITVLNSTGSDTKNVAFTIAPLSIISPLTATGTVGVNFTPYTIQATGNPNVFGATGLPAGLTIDTRTGIISGIPTDTATPTYNVTITASNGFGTASATLVITINPKPAGSPDINSALTFTGVDGIGLTYQITTTANNATSYNATGFPSGLVFDPNTGTLQGTTNQVGTYNVIIVATNASGSDAETLVLTINQAPPVITSPQSVTIPIGQFYSYSIATTGSQPQQYSVTPMPAGFSLNGNILSGTPTVLGVNPTVTISASNLAASVSQPLTIIVTQEPVFTAPFSTSGVIGDPNFAFTVTATGYPPPDLSVDPNDLPPGITFTPNAAVGNTVTGTFRGPATGAGQFFVPVLATNIINPTGVSQTISITIAPPTITSALILTGAVNVPISPYTITSTGSPDTFTAPGLPPGLSLAGATISGTPTTAGSTQVTITASNSVTGASASATLIIGISTIPGAPAIISNLVQPGSINTTFSYAILATNSPTSYSATGLPAGLSIDTDTGLIFGTPTVSGSFAVPISATNAVGTGTATLTIALADVAGGPVIVSPLTHTGQQFVAISPYQIVSINGPILSYGASGLPTGLTFDQTTGIIDGTPQVGGTFNVTLTATNAIGTSPPAVLVLTIASTSPTIQNLPQTITVGAGSTTPFTLVVTGLPTITLTLGPGTPSFVTLAGNVLTIVAPTAPGSFTVDVTATNPLIPPADTKTLTINVVDTPPLLTTPDTFPGQVGVPFTFTITASGSAPISFLVSPIATLSLPNVFPGVQFNSVNTISGVPTAAGTYVVKLAASHPTLGTNEKDIAFVIAEKPDDSDGDGYPDEFEIAMGSDPFAAGSTPLNGAPISDKRVISITNMQIKLNFTSTTKDSISLKGVLPTTGIDSFAGAASLVIGGIRKDFTLDAKGNGKLSNTDRLTVKNSTKTNTAKISAKLGGQNFKPQLVDEQLTGDFDLKNVSRQVRVFLLYKNTLFDSRKLLTYTVKANRTGNAKAAKATQP